MDQCGTLKQGTVRVSTNSFRIGMSLGVNDGIDDTDENERDEEQNDVIANGHDQGVMVPKVEMRARCIRVFAYVPYAGLLSDG